MGAWCFENAKLFLDNPIGHMLIYSDSLYMCRLEFFMFCSSIVDKGHIG